jgi:hypothetical protein
MFHFNPRPKGFSFPGGGEDVIVMNTAVSGKWGMEERIDLPKISELGPLKLEEIVANS